MVKPSPEKFDNGERPLNLHKNNIVWLNSSDVHDINVEGVQSTYVWGSTSDMGGSMVKLPTGFKGTITTEASEFRAVVISGTVDYHSTDLDTSKSLSAGSYVESADKFIHELTNKGDSEAIIYIRTNSKYEVN